MLMTFVLVDANPRIGAFDIDLTAFPHLRKYFKRNGLRNQPPMGSSLRIWTLTSVTATTTTPRDDGAGARGA
jgi:hypothetical protein